MQWPIKLQCVLHSEQLIMRRPWRTSCRWKPNTLIMSWDREHIDCELLYIERLTWHTVEVLFLALIYLLPLAQLHLLVIYIERTFAVEPHRHSSDSTLLTKHKCFLTAIFMLIELWRIIFYYIKLEYGVMNLGYIRFNWLYFNVFVIVCQFLWY